VTFPEPTSAPAVRPATPADYDLFARLFLELNVDDPVPSRETWQKEIEPATLVLEDEAGRGSGYAFVQVLAGIGYVRHIVVDPARRGRGFGQALMLAVARRLREQGCAQWCLNVKPDNVVAIALYQGLGMVPQYHSTALRFDWSLVSGLPVAADAVVRPVVPEDDAVLENTFGLAVGMLAHARAQEGRVIYAVVDQARGDALAGVAVFLLAFPGAFPFRVSRPELAGNLLLGLRPHALPSLSHMQVVAENDAELGRLLVERGASVRFEMVHLKGAIPAAAEPPPGRAR
jgi:GNAT superfamily N-acetyltransferase